MSCWPASAPCCAARSPAAHRYCASLTTVPVPTSGPAVQLPSTYVTYEGSKESVTLASGSTGSTLKLPWSSSSGNLKSIALGKLLVEHPERALEFAVKGMLPKNTLGRKMFRKLHVFAGGEHPHQAQQPRALEL